MASRTAYAAVVCLTALAVAGCERASTATPRRDRISADVFLPADSELISGHVPPGAVLGTLLSRNLPHPADVEGMLASLEGVFDARRVHAGQAYRFDRADDGRPRLFEYEIDGRSVLRITPRPGADRDYDAEVIPYDVRTTGTTVNAVLDGNTTSLFAAMSHAGEQPDLSVALAEIFAGEVDFNTDLQPGDRFALRVDKSQRDGRFVGYGAITAAEMTNGGRHLLAFRYQPAGGTPGYFDAEGRSLVRFFLRSPLKFDPSVTSGFSLSRLHPILNIRRAHLGVDYRAPEGAPVVAVSAGVVVAAGWTAGGGRTVRLRHASGYESGYLHLSAFGAGVRVGAHVAQGQIIGRVGATGLATAPHLHYELKKNGVHVNPAVEHRKLPPGDPVPPAQLGAFRTVRDAQMARLNAGAKQGVSTR
jgi:murein DD-endopeptidase MepM/ murein hydrolase activator NlpD